MAHVLGRRGEDGPAVDLGTFLARDGSAGAAVGLDLDRPHVGLVTGKRGSGKSHTMGVIAEGIAAATGVTGVIVDPMDVFAGLAHDQGATVVRKPTIRADALAPRSWCDLLDLDPTDGPGALLWRAADSATTLAGMVEAVEHSQAPRSTVQAVLNHLDLADGWGIFDPEGLDGGTLLDPQVTVLDVAGLPEAGLAAITGAVARQLYDRAVRTDLARLPWLLVDEAQAVIDGVAGRSLRRILTRGRHPGVSLVLGTQRPAALPPVAVSQADLLLSHRLTATADIDALAAARPTYLDEGVRERLPEGIGEAVVVDDATESAVTVKVRERRTPHGGGSPRASTVGKIERSPSLEPESASP